MGSPLGQTLANTFLCHYAKEWLVSCTIKFKPKLYKRYLNSTKDTLMTSFNVSLKGSCKNVC